MAITAGMVKELREMTGAGMMDCKKALTECNGDMDEAIEYLRKSGAMKAEKKASRIAAEGICRIAIDGGKAAVVEVNSETDFVAKNEVFQNFVETVAKQALASDAADVEGLLQESFLGDSSKTVKEARSLGITLIGIGDTNCDPEELDYIIPGNDDAIRAVKLIVGKMADAVIEANQGEAVYVETAEAEATDIEEVAADAEN